LAIARELVEILACPKCKGALTQEPRGFVCEACRLVFRVEDDIPNFLLDEALPLDGSR
jgi:uncharacterized protein YbaR (Trm112 family)